MNRRRSKEPFLEQLKAVVGSLRRMKPGEVQILSVNARYGHYQICVGAAKGGEEGRREGGKDRPIEIHGEIHHLFVSPDAVRANPSKRQMIENLKDTVIVRGLYIRLRDPKGDGQHLDHLGDRSAAVRARECINLAGRKGEKLIEDAGQARRLQMAAYRIIQEDILRTFKEHRDESTEPAE
ncbi:MAG: hypothetical protein V2A66_01985 [Pseudomonadota bacterium]